MVAAAAAASAAASGAEPTGTPVADAVLPAVFAALVTLAASRSRRWWWLVLAGPAAAFSSPTPWIWLGLASVALAFASTFDDERRRVVGAIVAALALQALLRLEPVGFFGLPSLIAAGAAAPVLLSGYRHSRRRTRRVVRRSVLAVTAFVALALAGVIVAGLGARSDVETGIDAARQGLDAARDGDQDAASSALATAAGAFGQADRSLGSWLVAPARLVPVLAQHTEAIATAAEEGRDVANAALDATVDADVDELRASNGRLDLEAITAMAGPLDRASVELADTLDRLDGIDSRWLVPPLSRRLDDLRVEIVDAAPDIDLAAAATTIVPDMLGASGDRRYLVLFPTPAESHELGGVIGNFSELTARDGQLEITRSGRTVDLYAPNPDGTPNTTGTSNYELADPSSYPPRYLVMNPGRFPQNLLATVDLATAARASADYYQQRFGVTIDGLIVIDPEGLAALLELTGPVDVPGWPVPISADNALDVLLRDQYVAFAGDGEDGDREAFLAAASDAAFEALLSIELPSPRQLGDVLGPAAHARHLQMYAFEPEASDFLATVGLLPTFPAVQVDSFASVTSAAEPHKLDAYLRRSIAYDVTLDPATGTAHATVTMRLENTTPSGLPEYVTSDLQGDGANRTRVSIYSPLAAISTTVDGQPAGNAPGEEFGRLRHQLPLTLPAGRTTTVVWELEGGLDLTDGYVLDLVALPRAVADQVTVTVEVADGWTATQTEGPTGDAPFDLVDDIRFAYTLTGADS